MMLVLLQSIITANVETLPVSECRPSALLTPQGRILIDMMVYRPTTDRFILRCDLARRDDLFAKLRRYRLRRPIEIAIEPDIKLYLVMAKPNHKPTRKQTADQIKDKLVDGAGHYIMYRSTQPRSCTHILANGAAITTTLNNIDIWHVTRIAAGIPEGATDLTP